jgi:hypothetical protein
LLSFADSTATAFAYATIYGLGIVYFWPTMLGVTAERFPKGGAFLLGLMGCVGNLAVALLLPVMGGIYDTGTLEALPTESRPLVMSENKLDARKLEDLAKTQPEVVKTAEIAGARQAFRKVVVLPVILVVIFAGIAISDQMRGGYKPEELPTKTFDTSEWASDY